MRKLRFLLQKEFIQIFRNRIMLPILFVMPIIQLIILANAATFELREIPVYLVDQDQSTLSREVMQSFIQSEFFKVVDIGQRTDVGVELIDQNVVKMVVVLPNDLENELLLNGVVKVQVLVDAVDGFAAGIAQQYVTRLLTGIQQSEVVPQGGQLLSDFSPGGSSQRVNITWSHWYNPDLEYISFMVPGILVLLVAMIAGFLSGMNVVREREIGTMEQLNVTPITKTVFIAGKLIPFWIIALVELGFGLIVARLVFDLVPLGSLWLIFGSAAVFLVVILALGLYVSTISDTQQQAMFITWFIMVLFILMGGLFTPIDSMPMWAQYTTYFNPMAWYIDVMRRVMLTGAELKHVYTSILVLAGMGMFILSAAWLRYKKVG
jgi:ABC-2 type transport system permease protein